MLHFWSGDVAGGIRASFCNRYLSYCPQAPQTKSPSEEIITQGGHINFNPMLWGLAPPYLPLPHLFQPSCCRGATLYLVHVWVRPVATHEGCVCAHVCVWVRGWSDCFNSTLTLMKTIEGCILLCNWFLSLKRLGATLLVRLLISMRAQPPTSGCLALLFWVEKHRAQCLWLPCYHCFTNRPKCRCHVTDAQ